MKSISVCVAVILLACLVSAGNYREECHGDCGGNPYKVIPVEVESSYFNRGSQQRYVEYRVDVSISDILHLNLGVEIYSRGELVFPLFSLCSLGTTVYSRSQTYRSKVSSNRFPRRRRLNWYTMQIHKVAVEIAAQTWDQLQS